MNDNTEQMIADAKDVVLRFAAAWTEWELAMANCDPIAMNAKEKIPPFFAEPCNNLAGLLLHRVWQISMHPTQTFVRIAAKRGQPWRACARPVCSNKAPFHRGHF